MSSILSHITYNPKQQSYKTKGNIQVYRTIEMVEEEQAIHSILSQIDGARGALYSSSYEYPGRYSRWDMGFVHPSLQLRSSGPRFYIEPLNERGEVLVPAIYRALLQLDTIEVIRTDERIEGSILKTDTPFTEEERTSQPSIFQVLRQIKNLFYYEDDSFLGLYGAFGYDLVFQLEPVASKHEREEGESEIILFLPDELTVVDHQMSCAYRMSYEFEVDGRMTAGLPRITPAVPTQTTNSNVNVEYKSGEYADLVRVAIEEFKVGNMFEVVPSQTLYEPCYDSPSQIFLRLKQLNPSPYGFIVNLGSEMLVGSSPEMYVRVENGRVETCPISGTIKRGSNAIEDANNIRELLNSAKDEAELTMCTDVDRNDKSRICKPGSVRVIGRRQLEMYSHLIHTVDHVEGYLEPQYDALDAFMTHMWAVTVTGAPKRAAIQWIEQHEQSPRGWYGGAVGVYSFNGNLNTGLTLRTIRIRNGMAEIRVGATLLYDSIPELEEEETLTKAAALVKAIRGWNQKQEAPPADVQVGKGKRILLVDHEDSFVHTLGNYFKQTGAEVITYRSSVAREQLAKQSFDLVVLSPGPGRPEQFQLNETIEICLQQHIPIFGVCLGLQGIVEYFGGALGTLDYPQHGKGTVLDFVKPCHLWDGLDSGIEVSRYHSLYASTVPDCLDVTALSEDGVVMAVRHHSLPITAVQFHPESILSLRHNAGIQMIQNVVASLSACKG
ncbi:anthranilate synthase component I [Paenibacillus sp. SC116]|uniref:anthranilate synthase component I n=1 Tax=Paenibacillus sp. SC116 TaxID=2968986 RepID=UPI00215AA017|nr:anthranilate synthase component I [Paenibacillus sp. SC116]MCR8844896.1 anthranilate synthase component I [Paenibacillus sp. SC116]